MTISGEQLTTIALAVVNVAGSTIGIWISARNRTRLRRIDHTLNGAPDTLIDRIRNRDQQDSAPHRP